MTWFWFFYGTVIVLLVLRLCGFPEAFLLSSPQGGPNKRLDFEAPEFPRNGSESGGGEAGRAPGQITDRLVHDNFCCGDSGRGADPNKVSGDYLDI